MTFRCLFRKYLLKFALLVTSYMTPSFLSKDCLSMNTNELENFNSFIDIFANDLVFQSNST